MTANANETEVKDEKQTLVELVTKVGMGVLRNPFLTAIIEAAPSPKAADEHMLRLGWPNILAQKVRQGVHLLNRCRSHSKKLWGEMTTIDLPLAHQMLEFGYKPAGLKIDSDLARCDCQWEEAFRLDGIRVARKRPLFLREMGIQLTGRCITSVDCSTNDQTTCEGFPSIDDLPLGDNLNLNFGYTNRSEWHVTLNAKRLFTSSFPHNMGAAYFEIGNSILTSIRMRTKNFLLRANPSKGRMFPCLYKALEIDKSNDESIRILLRQDFGPQFGSRGRCFEDEWVTYKKVEHVSNNIDIALEVWYQVFPGDAHLTRCDNKVPAVQICVRKDARSEQTELLPQEFRSVCSGDTLPKILELARNLLACSRVSVDLEKVAGISVATSPPKELADLFIPGLIRS